MTISLGILLITFSLICCYLLYKSHCKLSDDNRDLSKQTKDLYDKVAVLEIAFENRPADLPKGVKREPDLVPGSMNADQIKEEHSKKFQGNKRRNRGKKTQPETI